MNRFSLPILLAAVPISLGLGLAGCGGIDDPESDGGASLADVGDPVTGDWLVVHESGEPATLNPYLDAAGAGSVQIVNQNIFETLLKRDYETLELKPHIAKSYEISDDHLTYTFYLRDDVKFSDGKPLTAQDVKFTFDAIMDPANDTATPRSFLNDVKSVDVLDDYTIQISCTKPYFLHLGTFGELWVLPKHIYGHGDFNTLEVNRAPVGSGPYVFEEWATGSHITIARRDDYWGEKKPYLDKIRWLMITDSNAALQALKAGDMDFMATSSEQWVQQASKPSFERKFNKLIGWSSAEGYQGSFGWIGWNMRRPQLSDRRVRRAFTMLLDRQTIVETLLYNYGRVVTGPDFPDSPEYNKEIEPWAYDPARARALLDEAGWKDTNSDGIRDKDGIDLKVEFLMPSGSSTYERIATVFKEQMDKAGVDFRIKPLEWATFLESVTKRDFDACTMAWVSSAESDNYQIWHSSQSEKGSNYVGFVNEEVDKILEDARLEFDRGKRAKMYHRFHEILHEEQPYTFLFNSPRKVAVDKRFQNVKLYALGFDFHEWWVPKDRQKY